jgi:hypothetical protein
MANIKLMVYQDDEVIAGFRRGDEMNYTSFIESQAREMIHCPPKLS